MANFKLLRCLKQMFIVKLLLQALAPSPFCIDNVALYCRMSGYYWDQTAQKVQFFSDNVQWMICM